MRYIPWADVGEQPFVVVDGPPAAAAELVLSHWRGSGTPDELLDDLSTQIVFRYLDRSDLRVATDLVSNDHFDEDGLSGIYAMVDPEAALQRRDLLCDVASAGDFGTFRARDAARIAIAIQAFYDETRSPMERSVFTVPYEQQTAILYSELLGVLPELLEHPERYRELWEEQDARITEGEEGLAAGTITIEERPEIDLAIVRAPTPPSEMAINNATDRHRIVTVTAEGVALRYRYETWVRYISRQTMPRLDLAPLAEQLTAAETGGATWMFDGVERITPSLRASGASSLALDAVVADIEAFMRAERSSR